MPVDSVTSATGPEAGRLYSRTPSMKVLCACARVADAGRQALSNPAVTVGQSDPPHTEFSLREWRLGRNAER